MVDEGGLLLRWGTLVIVTYVLQLGVVSDLEIAGVHPQLLLLLGICAGLAGGPARGAEVGFAAGLLADVMVPGTLGVAALSTALAGFAVGMAHESVIRSSRAISIVLAGLGSAVGILLYALLGQLLGQRSLADPRLLVIVGIVALAGAALSTPVLAVCRWAEGSSVGAGIR